MVTAVEISKEACLKCKETAQAHSLPTLKVIPSSVEAFLSHKKSQRANWNTVILNPPRQGVSKEVLEMLLTLDAQELHYISCHAATLRRDLLHLCKAGWRIEWAKGYDMFPQTTHFETYLRLSKK